MAEVIMVWDMPRTVFNWPHPGEVFVTTDEDAEHLVSRGYARWPGSDADEPDSDSQFEDDSAVELAADESDDDFDNDFEDDDFDSDEESARPPRSEIVKKPRAVDSKSKWLTYARSKGYTGDDTITKNRLVAEYGD